MTDHMSAIARTAHGTPTVTIEQPSWMVELLSLLVLVLGILCLVLAGQTTVITAERDAAQGHVEIWQELALAGDKVPTVRVSPEGPGFKCSAFNVRREWERAVLAECQVMGALLHMARASP